MNQILSSSITYFLGERLCDRYERIAQRVVYIFHRSLAYRLAKELREKIKVYFIP